jgi:hypothetical protein
MAVTGARKKTNYDRPNCFAYKECRDGERAFCTALKEINCLGCAFYKDKEAYKRQLFICECRNRILEVDKKYKPINEKF